jgi:hypothetical protein
MHEMVRTNGPVDAWVKEFFEQDWVVRSIYGVVLSSSKPYKSDHGSYSICSLTRPTTKICRCRSCKRPFEMPMDFAGSIWCEACDPHMQDNE